MEQNSVSTFSIWQSTLRKFLQKDKRLRTGIIATSTGLSGVDVSKDHSPDQLTALTALLGAFYSNMVELREILQQRDVNEARAQASLVSESEGFLEIGLGYIFTKNGASYKHFVSLTDTKEYPNRTTLTAFLAARGRDKIENFNNWLKLYYELAPLILELDSQDGWTLPPWDFTKLELSSSVRTSAPKGTPRFWMENESSQSGDEKIHQRARLLILALEDMLAFKGTQGLWFEHYVLMPSGILHPQYFVFLFPKNFVKEDKNEKDELSRAFISAPLQLVLPLSILPKCRVFFQLLVNIKPIPEPLEQQFFSLVRQWNLDSEQSRNQITELLNACTTFKGFERDLEAITSLLKRLKIL